MVTPVFGEEVTKFICKTSLIMNAITGVLFKVECGHVPVFFIGFPVVLLRESTSGITDLVTHLYH